MHESFALVQDRMAPVRFLAGLSAVSSKNVIFKQKLFFSFCSATHTHICIIYHISRKVNRHKEVFSELTQLEDALSFRLTAFLSWTASLLTQTTSSCGTGCREKTKLLKYHMAYQRVPLVMGRRSVIHTLQICIQFCLDNTHIICKQDPTNLALRDALLRGMKVHPYIPVFLCKNTTTLLSRLSEEPFANSVISQCHLKI